ncbi:MAG TPA: hypothetical protein VGD06_09245 [Acidobacteriota bacterium]
MAQKQQERRPDRQDQKQSPGGKKGPNPRREDTKHPRGPQEEKREARNQ